MGTMSDETESGEVLVGECGVEVVGRPGCAECETMRRLAVKWGLEPRVCAACVLRELVSLPEN